MPVEAPPAPPRPAFVPPAPDVTVQLEIGDFIDRLPPNFLQPGPFDRKKKVEFQAAELYSDLSKGRASVPASVIYQHCPEIFARPVSDTEDTEISLQLQKLVEQIGMALNTRTDQEQEENVGEIETPFLQVAMEDNARLPTAVGSTAGAIRPPAGLASAAPFRPTGEPSPEVNGETVTVRPNRPGHISTISPVKPPAEVPPPAVAAPTAATAGPIIPGNRPPSTVRASVAGGKIRLSGPAVVNRIAPAPGGGQPPAPPSGPGVHARAHSQRITLPTQALVPPTSPSHQVSKKTARIQIPPISLKTPGANSTPRPPSVPAPPTAVPGAEPMPNFRPNVGKEAIPPISFRSSPPPPSVKPVPHSFAPPRPPAFPPPAFPAAPAPVPAAPAPAPVDDRKIELGLAAVLRSLPSSMLAVEPSAVPDEVRFSLPFELVEPQLSHGRVSIPRETFIKALPEMHRQVLSADDPVADIPLPLQEVFQNLPSNALSLRQDQVKEETGVHYPTPFSEKAAEDAQRFATSAPVPPPETETPAPEAVTEEIHALEAVAEAPTSDVANAVSAPEPHDDSTADTVTDLSLDALQTPLPASDAELPADPSPTPARDVPLDLEDTPTAESPALTPEVAEATPVEARGESAVEAVRPDEMPEAETAPTEAAIETPASVSATIPAHFAAKSPTEMLEAPVAPVEEKTAQPAVAAPVAHAPIAGAAAPVHQTIPPQDNALQTVFMTEDNLDAKSIVKLVCTLPSVTGCAVMFEDGLRLAGNFPNGDTEGFSAMAAPFYKKAVRFVSELELGSVQTLTLHTDNGLLSFFMHDNICVSVRHTGRGFLPGVREKLEIVTRELARMYSTAKPNLHPE